MGNGEFGGARVSVVFESTRKPILTVLFSLLRFAEEGLYLTLSGQYALCPSVMHLLGENIANHRRERGEYQLTSVLERVREQEGFQAVLMDGERFDIGVPMGYAHTLATFGSK
jgi:UTP-glucose-1-phosphate uridylyltransferase